MDGRITKQEFETKTPLVKSVRLSLDTSTGIQKPGKLESWLSSREELPGGSAWAGDQNQATHLSAETAPESWSVNQQKFEEETPKRVDEIVDWMYPKRAQPAAP